MQQTTLNRSVSTSGIGLHSGRKVRVTLSPAPADSGIVFHLPNGIKNTRIVPTPKSVIATGLATTLGTPEASVSTVEHVLAAMRGMSIDNVIIKVEGGELPILDGSALEFARLVQRSGVRELNAPRRVLRIARPIDFVREGKSIRAVPYCGFKVDYTIDFPHPSIGRQRMVLDLSPDTFGEVAASRTFGFLREVEYLRSKGLALGGSLDNAVVLDDTLVLNEEGLRSPDEFVRHKILDFIGDMAMLGMPLQGSFEVSCSGHELNNQFVRMLEADAMNTLVLVDYAHQDRELPCCNARFPLIGMAVAS